VQLDSEFLISTATQATGLTDFGEHAWTEGLNRLLDALEKEAGLTDLGRMMATQEIGALLANRLRVVDWRSRAPETAMREVKAPLVIAGLPRTGTTILHDLLAQDRELHRAPLTWEVSRPVPPAADGYDADPRIDEVQAEIDIGNQLMPDLMKFHPVGARLAQECVRITAGDFRSMTFPAQYRVPGYMRWLLNEADMAPAYRWHRAFLQHLQTDDRPRRWLLKAPAHTWHLPALLAEYPDAVVIQLHRDPLRVVASVSGLVTYLRTAVSEGRTPAETAAEYVEPLLDALARAEQARDSGLLTPNQVIDIGYRDFVADPLRTVHGIYDRLGIPLSATAEQAMRDFLAACPAHTGSRYGFAETGLDAGALRGRVQGYQERFGVADEPLA
jgi:Sulfotransferase family